jgi:FtsH-binding integral membrane protein
MTLKTIDAAYIYTAARILLVTFFMLTFCLAYFSILITDFQRTKRYDMPEDETQHGHCCQNLRLYLDIINLFFFLSCSEK